MTSTGNGPVLAVFTSKRNYLLLAMIVGWLVFLALFVAAPAPVAAADSPDLELTKTTFASEVDSGESYEYILNYRCASINEHCEGAVITDPLPPEVEYVPGTITKTPHVLSASYDGGTHTITWVFKEPLPAGSTGILKFAVQFPPGTLPGETAANDATFTATNAVSVTTPEVITSVKGQFEMYADKTGGQAVIGFPTTYTLGICSPDTVGGVGLISPTMIDELPPEAIFIGAQGNQCAGNVPPGPGAECWVYDDSVSPRTVTFYNLPDVDVGACFERTVTLQYDSDPPATQENVLQVIGTPEGCEDPGNLPPHCEGETERNPSNYPPFEDILGIDPIAPYPSSGGGKSSSSPSSYDGTEALPGETVSYVVSAENTGYVELTNATVTDEVPVQVTVTAWTIELVSDPGEVNGFYQVDNSGTWVALLDNPFDASANIDATTLDLGGGTRITDIRWDIGTMAVGSDPWSVTVTAVVDDTIDPQDPSETFANCTTLSSDQLADEENCNSVSIIDERAIPRAEKTSARGPYLPLEFVDFTASVSNDGVAHLNFDNPVLADLLLPEFDYVAGSAHVVSKPAGAPDPNLEVIPNYNGTGRTLLRWSWQNPTTTGACDPSSIEGLCGANANYSLKPGEEMVVGFQVQIVDGTPPGEYINHAAIVDWSGPTDPDNPNQPHSDPRQIFLCTDDQVYTDVNDLDGDGLTTEIGCQDSSAADVGVFLAMNSEKFVRGTMDCTNTTDYGPTESCEDEDFNKLGLTVPGGYVDYKVEMTNESNVPVTNITFVDITPYIDDTGVIDPSSRLSQWRPNLQTEVTEPVAVPVTIFYSTESNPCRPDLVPDGPAGCTEPEWTTDLPANPTAVQSIKVDFCEYDLAGEPTTCLELARNDTLTFDWRMVAPNGSPGDASCLVPADDSFVPGDNPACKIAWNSFGFTADQAKDTDGTPGNDPDALQLLPAEPIKVGMRLGPEKGLMLGNYVWLDNPGLQNDGIQQDEERVAPWGVDGVRVELWDNSDPGNPVFLDFRITGPDHLGNPGYYLFPDLPTDDYILRFFPPPGYTASPANQGSDDSRDSDGEIEGNDPTHGTYWQTENIELLTDSLDWDFGIWQPTDYGDAPYDNTTDFYPTSASDLAAAGDNPAYAARHIIYPGLYMGESVDAELDGQPEVPATGDDTNPADPDDEDGVTFDQYLGTPAQPSGIMVIGETSTITVDVVVPDLPETEDPDEAYLNAWIDWNGDGDWDDTGEQIAVDISQATTSGDTITLNVPVPAGATPGTTHARFRFSFEDGLPPAGSGEIGGPDYISGTARSGEVEDYQVQLITKPVKSIKATSEAHTENEDVAIGEIVRYELRISVPEGEMTNFVVTDSLPDGLQFLNDGSAALIFEADGAMSSTEFTISGGPFGSGTNPIFTLGTVTNPDEDPGEEFVVIEFNALVLNITENIAGVDRDNDFTVTYDTFNHTTKPVTVNVVEPDVSIAKTVSVTPPVDGGDVVTYQLQITNNAGSDAAIAYDLEVLDNLDVNLDLLAVGDVTWTAPVYASVTNNSDATTDDVEVLIDRLNVGDAVTISIKVTIVADVPIGQVIPNVADLDYTSLPGPKGTESNPTGSVTPGDTDDEDGERLYGPSSNTDITIDTPQIDKLQPDPSIYTIGETVVYTIKVTLPEGTTADLKVIDDLPVGLSYQSHEIIDTAAASGGLLGADFNGTLAVPVVTPSPPGASGADVTFDFGTTTTAADNSASNNSFLIKLTTVVLNVYDNQDGDILENVAKLTYTEFNDVTPTTETITDDPVDISLIEPVLKITKELVTPLPYPIGPGAVLNYLIVIEHDGASHADAFDVVMTDLVPAGLTNINVTSISADNITAPDSSVVANKIRVPSTGSFDLPQDASVTVEYSAELTSAYIPSDLVDNQAGVVWTSMPDSPPEERNGGPSGEPDGDNLLGDGSPEDPDDYEVQTNASVQVHGEWGDLPDTYPTLLADDGATHLMPIGSNVYLGSAIDDDDDGQPSNAADGDDNDSDGDDEDGVVFLTPVTADKPVTIQITANAAGYLHGWFDFNADDTLDDILITHVDGVALSTPVKMRDYPISAGPHTYTFDAPTDTTPLDTIYSRFRITSYDTTTDPEHDPAGPLGPGGHALDGEVEDYALLSIGNLVWFDYNGNAIQDGGSEVGIPGVAVNLLDGTGAQVLDAADNPITTSTDADGHYNFGGLPEGDYIIEIDASNWQPGGVFAEGGAYEGALGSEGQGIDDQVNTDDNGAPDVSAVTGGVQSLPINLTLDDEPTLEDPQETTANANSDLTIDFGFYLPVELGDLVWFDVNNDGVFNGESGIADVTVDLYQAGSAVGVPYRTTSTDGNGRYIFNDIPPGDYYVHIPASEFLDGQELFERYSTIPTEPDPDDNENDDPGTENTGGSQSGPGDENGLNQSKPASTGISSGVVTLDLDLEPLNDNTGGVATLDDDDSNLTVDFGFFEPVNLGDYVWIDANADGFQDPVEVGLPKATVELFLADGMTPADDITGNPVASQMTDTDGLYNFINLPPGQYVVKVTPPAGYEATEPATVDPNDNDNTDSNGFDPDAVINGGPVFSKPIELTSQGEPDTPADGDDTNGNWTLDFGFVVLDWGDLPEKPYPTTMLNNGARHVIDGTTYLGAGVDDEVDGQPDAAALGDDTDADGDDEDGVTFLTPIAPDQRTTIEVVAGSEGYLNAWIDFEADSTLDVVNLNVTVDGVSVASLNDVLLTAGSHTIEFDVPSTATTLDTIYSRFRFTSGPGEATEPTGRAPNGEVEDYALLSLGNRVWLDKNADGVLDTGEIGIDDVTVNLLYGDGTPVLDANNDPITAVTSGGGLYNFGGLPEGDYVVEVAASNWNPTEVFGTGGAYEGALGSPDQGGDDQVNTDDNGNNDGTAAIGVGMQSVSINLTLATEPGNEDPQETNNNLNSDLTIDFGVYLPVSLGSLVWQDLNGDGVQDVGEPPITGATVTLLDGAGSPVTADLAGSPINPIITDGTGIYNFSNLPPGDYIVQVEPPAGYAPSPVQEPDSNTNNNTDSNIELEDSPDVYWSGVVTLSNGDEPAGELFADGSADQDGNPDVDGNMTVDFGFVEPVSLGSLVWQDTDLNGLQDDGEPPIAGATVTLLDDLGNLVTQDLDGNTIIPIVTDGTGIYNFENLPPGDYIVRVEPPAGYVPTVNQVADPENDDNSDSNVASDEGSGIYHSGVVSLSNGGEPTDELFADGNADQDGNPDADGNMTVDFGFVSPVSLGSLVWLDVSRDGIQDADEPTIEGAVVTLFDEFGVQVTQDISGNSISPITTGSDGIYHFVNLSPGNYIVQVAPPAGYTPTDVQESDANTDLNTDSNIATDEGGGVYRSGIVALNNDSEPTGEIFADGSDDQDGNPDEDGNMTVDFGFVAPVSLGSLVWQDLDGNGMQDVGEPPIAGATVTLLDDMGAQVTSDLDGNPISPIVTDGTGIYHFTNLPPGDYIVQVQPPAGYSPSPIQTTDPENDDNTDSNIAVEFVPEVYHSGIVTLLPETEPVGEVFADGTADQDGNPDEDGNMTLDFGFVQPVSLGSLVWRDLDADGVQDVGEPPIEGATVTLLDEFGVPVTQDLDGVPINPVITGGDGLYNFENLPPGDYLVQVTPPLGYAPSPVQEVDPNTDDNTDSNIESQPVANVFQSGIVSLANGAEPQGELSADGMPDQDGNPDLDGNMTVDFGFVVPASLGSLVWQDIDLDGTQDVGEPPISGAVVTLLDGNGAIVTHDTYGTPIDPITTDGTGIYNFSNLPPGDYIVQVEPPTGFIPTAVQEPDANTDDNTDSNVNTELGGGVYQSNVVVLQPGTEPTGELFADGATPDQDGNPDPDGNMTVDFGFVIGSEIMYDFGDLPEPHPTAGPVNYPTTLANNGASHLIVPGVYLGALVDAEDDGQPDVNAGLSTAIPGGDDQSPVGVSDDEDGVVFLTPLLPGTTAQIQVTASVPGFLNAWIDWNNNGVLEAGLENVFVDQPLTGGGTPDVLFVNVPAGIDPTSLYSRFRYTTQEGVATEPTGEAPSGEVEDYVLMSLGDTVWKDDGAGDHLNNGLIDNDETGVPEVVVNLYEDTDASGDLTVGDLYLGTTTTDGNGNYLFPGLPEGDYIVEVDPVNFDDTRPLDGQGSSTGNGMPAPDPDDNVDNDDNGDPVAGFGVASQAVTLAYGTEPAGVDGDTNANPTVDFGFVEPVSLGSLVWRDLNSDGTQDDGEPGIEGAIVTLLDGAGNPVTQDLSGNTIDPITTGPDGIYHFTNLPPGDYIVQVEPGGGLAPSPVQVLDPENNDNSDSNIASEPSTGVYQSGTITLSNGDEPTGEVFADGTDDQDNNPDEDGNMTLDFGFVQAKVAIGNFVWHDVDNNSKFDGGETGLDPVVVKLYQDGDGDGIPEPDGADGMALATTTTADNGFYQFLDLDPTTGATTNYFVVVEKTSVEALGFNASSTGGRHNPDTTGDHPADGGDDGIPEGAYVISQPFPATLGGQLDTGDSGDPPGYDDASAYMTVDFGFFNNGGDPTAVSLTNMNVDQRLPISLLLVLLALASLAVFGLRLRRTM